MSEKQNKRNRLFADLLSFFDANLLTIIIGVFTGLAINTLTGFGYHFLPAVAFVLFVSAIVLIIVMLQIQKAVKNDEIAFLQLNIAAEKQRMQDSDSAVAEDEEADPFENAERLAAEQAITTDSKRRKVYFRAASATVICFLIAMVLLYIISTASAISVRQTDAKLTQADSLMEVQARQIVQMKNLLLKDDSLIRQIRGKVPPIPKPVITTAPKTRHS